MKAQVIVELIGAFTAFVTMGLACIELYARGKAKKAENAIDIYAEFLFVTQHLEYAQKNIEVLVCNFGHMTSAEIKAFAKNYIIDSSLIEKIHKIENISIRSFDYSKEEGRAKSQRILEFTGTAINLVNMVNTFYTAIIEGENYSAEGVRQRAGRVQDALESARSMAISSGVLLHGNLHKLHNMSRAYVIFLFAVSIAMVVLCVVL